MSKEWQSSITVHSQSWPGVDFVIARITFGRRLDLLKRVRDLAVRLEYFDAGREEKNRIEASLLGAQLDRLYLEWGLEEVRGLEIDGVAATTVSLMDRGPEELFQEALAAVKAECGLNEQERKN
jgi:hypothetical protein